MSSMREPPSSRRSTRLASVAALLVGCAGTPTPKAPSPSLAPAPGVDVDGTSHPSERLARAWPFEAPRASLFLDVRRAVDSALGRELLKRNERLFDPAQWSCLEPLLAHTQELVAAIDERGFLVLATADSSISLDEVGAKCASAMRWHPTTIAGCSNAWTGSFSFWQGGELDMAVAPSGLLAIGSRGLVDRALVGREPRHTSLDELRLGTSEVLTGRLGFAGAIHFASVMTNESFAFRADATFADERIATTIESSFGPRARARALSSLVPTLEPNVARALEHLSDAVRFVRDGRRISVTLELREPPPAQALDLEIVAAMVQSFAKRESCRALARIQSPGSTPPDESACDEEE